MKKLIRWFLGLGTGTAVLFGLWMAGQWFINDYPPGRIWYRLSKAENIYEYEQIDPLYLKTDPAKLIEMSNPQGRREALTHAIFGQETVPYGLRPDAVMEQTTGQLSDVARQSWRLELSVDDGHYSVAEVFYPITDTKRVVLYHHGYASTFWRSEALIRDLLEAGVAVIAFNQAAYGHNKLKGYHHPRFGYYLTDEHRFMAVSSDPMGYFFKPVTAAINWALYDQGFERVDMTGLSNGGWQTAVQAAFDPRIQTSIPVAGVYPLYLTLNVTYWRPPEHFYRPMIHAANYLEMFVLAALESHRAHIQIFNQYDKCCYMNTKSKLYEPAVKDAVADLNGGTFLVHIDDTHADHQISAHGRHLILEALDLL